MQELRQKKCQKNKKLLLLVKKMPKNPYSVRKYLGITSANLAAA